MNFRGITIFKLIVFVILTTLFTSQSYGASIEAGENIYIAENKTGQKDLYLFGSTITSDAFVTNDLTAAAGTVTVNGDISGSLIAAGGDVFIRSKVGNTLRVAGGNIVISGETRNDVLVAGGNIRITDTASISGDLLILGGDIQINGPIKGKVYINGGQATLNAEVGGNLEGEIGTLTLGSKANIKGDLKYKATEKAKISDEAKVQGKTEFQFIEDKNTQKKASIITTGSIYKLVIDIVISLLFLSILPIFTNEILIKVKKSPLVSFGTGFIFLFFWPLFSIFLLMLVWLGIAAFLFYGLAIITSIYLGKIFLGWLILNAWYKRDKKEYILNWKAAIVGSISFFILFLIPFIGWSTVFALSLMMIGAFVRYILALIQAQNKKVTT